LTTKKFDFAQKNNKTPKYSLCRYLERYIFTDLHEAFFCEFPHFLKEWILKFKYNHPNNQIRSVEWATKNIAHLQRVDNKFTRAVDVWLDNIIEGFIIKFVVDTAK
jgi:hypothetical protein